MEDWNKLKNWLKREQGIFSASEQFRLEDMIKEVDSEIEALKQSEDVVLDGVSKCDHDWQAVFHFGHHVCDYCNDCQSTRK